MVIHTLFPIPTIPNNNPIYPVKITIWTRAALINQSDTNQHKKLLNSCYINVAKTNTFEHFYNNF